MRGSSVVRPRRYLNGVRISIALRSSGLTAVSNIARAAVLLRASVVTTGEQARTASNRMNSRSCLGCGSVGPQYYTVRLGGSGHGMGHASEDTA